MTTPGLNNITVTPRADGSIDVLANVTPGALTIPTAKSFNLTALLKLIEDLATDVPVIIADVQAVFAASTPVPTPAPRLRQPPFHPLVSSEVAIMGEACSKLARLKGSHPPRRTPMELEKRDKAVKLAAKKARGKKHA